MAAALTLVSFAAADADQPLLAALTQLGYRVELLPGHVWLGSEPQQRHDPLVLYVCEPHYPRTRILSALRGSVWPCSGVCDRSQAPDADILGRCGEFAYWPCETEELALRLNRALSLPQSPAREEAAVAEEFVHFGLIGSSPAFLHALRMIKRVARSNASVLIQGETGTGKELAARAIHYTSARRDGPFIPVNGGAIPEDLIENELFGHARGAFTDAKDAQPGAIALAEGGTLFLDEIEALSAKAQVALLRFLQDRCYRVLGGRVMQEANVRVIAAGNEDLAERARTGRFREDLYFRLDVASVRLPPLRKREGDVKLLAEHFLARYAVHHASPPKTLHPATLRRLQACAWPGNVRELENFIHRQYLMSDDSVITPQCLPPARDWRPEEPGDTTSSEAQFQDAKRSLIARFEVTYLGQLIERAQGNVTLAARRAGVERRALGKLLKKHGLDAARYRG